MSLAARLNRLTPALTGKQRALLVIRAHLDGREPDRDLLTNFPSDQRREYDYYIALHYTANTTLGVLCQAFASGVAALEYDLEQFTLLGKAAAQLAEDQDDNRTRRRCIIGGRQRP